MKTYEELKAALMKAQFVEKKQKEKAKQVEKCVEMELAIQKEIEESIKAEELLQTEIEQRKRRLDQMLTEKYHLIYAEDIQKLQQHKVIVDVSKIIYDNVLQCKKVTEKNTMTWVQTFHVKNYEVFYTNVKGEIVSKTYDDMEFPNYYSEYKAELAIIQLVEKLFQLDKVDIEISYPARRVEYVLADKNNKLFSCNRVIADTKEPLNLTYTEKVAAAVKQQASRNLSADEFAKKVLNSKNSEIIAAWLAKNVESNLIKVSNEQSNKFIELHFEMAVYEKMVSLGLNVGENNIEENFGFEVNNMQNLSGEDMCIGLAKALVTLLKLKLKEHHELADIKEIQMGSKYKLVFREINPEYSGLTGWEE